MKKILLAVVILCSNVGAKDIGTFGRTYEISEKDAISWIYEDRLPELAKSGKIREAEETLKQRAYDIFDSPAGYKLEKAKKNSKRYQSLLVKAAQDYRDVDGNVLIHKGQSVNPAENLPESKKTLLIIDGHSKNQVRYAVQEQIHNNQVKIMLVSGSPAKLSREHGTLFFFDQNAAIIKKYQIARVPTKIYREYSNLVIEEIALKEDANE